MWLFALLAWDFGFYWLHRSHHRFRVLAATRGAPPWGAFPTRRRGAQLPVFVVDVDPVRLLALAGAAVGIRRGVDFLVTFSCLTTMR